MIRDMPECVSPDLITLARANRCGELGWRYPAVLEVVAALAAGGYAILGGDVMYPDDEDKLDYYRDSVYCGNWYLNRQAEDSWAEYVAASVASTQRYIEAYVRRNDDTYWFVPTYTDEQGFAALSEKRT